MTNTLTENPSPSEHLVERLVAERLLTALADRCRATLDVTRWLIEEAAAIYGDPDQPVTVPPDDESLSPEEALLLHRHAEMTALRDGLT